jgi:hypothetical protein
VQGHAEGDYERYPAEWSALTAPLAHHRVRPLVNYFCFHTMPRQLAGPQSGRMAAYRLPQPPRRLPQLPREPQAPLLRLPRRRNRRHLRIALPHELDIEPLTPSVYLRQQPLSQRVSNGSSAPSGGACRKAASAG